MDWIDPSKNQYALEDNVMIMFFDSILCNKANCEVKSISYVPSTTTIIVLRLRALSTCDHQKNLTNIQGIFSGHSVKEDIPVWKKLFSVWIV